jgi:GTP-binding protein YchF
MLQAGIVGLPNVGKSTLFNALTKTRKAEAANYPFCTIEPNVGVVEVPDPRLAPLAQIGGTNTIIPAAIEFVDIAGLVAGASKGEGLGNKFLANIREVDAIVHVVRCFEDADIIHSMGSVDPIRDIEVISMELVLADMESVERQIKTWEKKAKSGDKEARAHDALLRRLLPHLEAGSPVITLEMDAEERALSKFYNLLTNKRILYACNVLEAELSGALEGNNPYVSRVSSWAKEHHGADFCVICARVEEELAELEPDEAREYLAELGVQGSGCTGLIRAAYRLLGLASYFTTGEKETRAWTFRQGMKAPQCAGVIHTDFEKKFIKAEVVSYEELVSAGSISAARERGTYRLEGKEYLFQDGDVALFKVGG